MSMLRLARVAATHPEDNSVDIVMVDDGSRIPNVQVLAPTAMTDCGYSDLPEVGATGEKFSLTQSTDRDALAVIGYLAPTVPVVLGFLWPQVNGVLFADKNRRVMRHASDVYTTTDGQGNFELYHPSGTYLRIGTSPDHEDLTGKDFDGKWKITKNTDKAVHLKLRVSNAGDDKASIAIDPGGNIALQCDGNLTAQVGGNLSATITGMTTVNSGGKLTATAPEVLVDSPTTTFTGQVIVQGLLTYQAGMAGSGGGSNAAQITGNVQVTGNVSNTGTLTNNGKNVGSTHTHGGVQTGGGNTAVPN